MAKLNVSDLLREDFRLVNTLLTSEGHFFPRFVVDLNSWCNHAPCAGTPVGTEGELFVNCANCDEIDFRGEDAAWASHVRDIESVSRFVASQRKKVVGTWVRGKETGKRDRLKTDGHHRQYKRRSPQSPIDPAT